MPTWAGLGFEWIAVGSAGLFAGVLGTIATSAIASTTPGESEPEAVSVSADQLLAFADRARDAGDVIVAETAYRALFGDSSVHVRNEARFRLALLFVAQKRFSDAAVLFREILDEQPNAQRVRLELARVLDLMGDEAGARRALREAQAGGLPPDVARFVDRYSAALRARKPLGASIDVAVAPDTNINRATRSQTLGTVLGDFVLNEDARQRSGVGLALRGQTYARLPLSEKANLLGRISGSADLYRHKAFNDLAVAVSAGPELRLGADRLSLELGGLWRWYGGRPYSRAATIGLSYIHPLDRQSQLRGSANVAFVENRLNSLLDGRSYTASLSYERALSNRAGIGVTLGGDRQALKDPGYATWGGHLTLFGYREIGSVTLVGTLGHGRLKADERVVLYPEKRSDRLYRASIGATVRSLRLGSFAPFIRATFERNRSTTEIYDYRRVRTEFGIARAF